MTVANCGNASCRCLSRVRSLCRMTVIGDRKSVRVVDVAMVLGRESYEVRVIIR
jgi:hypothetical protein